MLALPPLPQPQLSDLVAIGAAACMLGVGVVLLMWGRMLGRAFLALCGAAVGAGVAGPYLAGRLGVSVVTGRLVAIITLTILGLVVARVIWAMLGAAICSAAAGLVLVERFGPTVRKTSTLDLAETTTAYAHELMVYLWDGLGAMWTERAVMVATVCGLAWAIPLVLAMVCARLGRIVMTALLGAVAMVMALALAGGQVRTSLWEGFWKHYYVPAVMTAVLLLVGIAYQYRGAINADRKDAEESEATPTARRKKIRDCYVDEE